MNKAISVLNKTNPISAEQVLELILEALRELVDYELAVVMGFEDKNVLKVRKAIGPLSSKLLNSFTINLNMRKDIARILDERKAFLFDENIPHVDTYDEIIEMPENHSCLVAPLYMGDRVIGMMTLDHRMCSKFTPEIVRFVSTISKLISVALVQTDASQSLIKKTESLLLERNVLLQSSDIFKDMVGTSRAWTTVLDSIKLVAASDVPVLISGETGTGKEQAARTIHMLSNRAEKPFVPVNCSALVQSLAESEIFGHEKGAFSGAAALRKGRFELADGGTLFLDEVGDLPFDLQPKLLRVLQDGKFERVGGEKPVSVDVRIIAATNVDLAEAVAMSRFREDLLYRLDVFPLRLPPLRERGDDTALLAEHFISDIRKRKGFENTSLSMAAIEKLMAMPWHGNVRELKNVVERAAILSQGGEIPAEHLVPGTRETYVLSEVQKRPVKAADNKEVGDKVLPEEIKTFDEAQIEIIERALSASNGKIYGKDGAAALLDLKPGTLQSKMKKLGIKY
ncbi:MULTISPECIES: sigma 54-interacting transcriptional regulator [unclassified Treponema]|uniref:sigma-54-dependent Fis family transcriptional regulator n=1 Tax=unclassified Treponema TaxID=2638727 RepID=UPI0020A57CD1|nr:MULTISPECIES: sigma 54-interacting transcriptional regulator [unclassified Treponema]UTC66085.1 sigma 54-interacting transcriptional regulator [Treponema sp. OMZ 789]UTC68815.1 sigma 54-interacting transcriptional regulator [Treponema sp. OMZ 790]UTC71543.1 sigma 54-interacting transcriptional regulator [Treponema sp. OMZ 791]